MNIQLTQEQWDVLYTSMQIVEYYNNLTLVELEEQLTEAWPDIPPCYLPHHLEKVIDSIHRLEMETRRESKYYQEPNPINSCTPQCNS